MNDILPGEVATWQELEQTARRIFHSYGFSEIRVPVVEKTELFCRSIGESTDIVEKEMYTFTDKGGTSLTLRPEGTAPVMRAFIEHKLHAQDPVAKLYYLGPMFRYERPQKGRYRQFHQIGAEVIGLDDPRCDAQVLTMLADYFAAVGITDVQLQINSLGCRSAGRATARLWSTFSPPGSRASARTAAVAGRAIRCGSSTARSRAARRRPRMRRRSSTICAAAAATTSRRSRAI